MTDHSSEIEDLYSEIAATDDNLLETKEYMEELKNKINDLKRTNKYLENNFGECLQQIYRVLSALAENRVKDVFINKDGVPEFTINEH